MKIFDNTVFDTKAFFKTTFVLLVITALQMATSGNAYVFMVPIAIFAILTRRVEQMTFWLMCSVLLIIGNKYFMPASPAFLIAQRGMFAFMGLVSLMQITSRRSNPIVAPFLWMFLYIFYMAIVSAAGWNPTISYLKLILFSAIYLAYYGVANLAGQSHRFDERVVRSIILAVCAYLILGSIALIPFPALGQLSGEEFDASLRAGHDVVSLFKGMTMHSQTLAPVMASTFALLFADLVINVRKMNVFYLVLLLLCPYLIYMTSSRTGMLALMAGIAVPSYCVVRMRGIGVRWRGKVKSALFVLFAAAFVAFAAVPQVRDSVVRFALKWNKDARASDFTVTDAVSSRQGLIDSALDNFKKSPVIGNGFQVSEAYASLRRSTLKDLLSAPIEKGVWLTAILEEGGFVGFMILVGFYLCLGLTLLRRGAYTGLTTLSVLLFANMGEFTMFSMSAMGGYAWAMVFVGVAMDCARIRRDSRTIVVTAR